MENEFDSIITTDHNQAAHRRTVALAKRDGWTFVTVCVFADGSTRAQFIRPKRIY